jgi:hypothetical protein
MELRQAETAEKSSASFLDVVMGKDFMLQPPVTIKRSDLQSV